MSSFPAGSVALLLATSATAQLTWSQVSTGTPPARSAAAACWSFNNTAVIVFGGLQGSTTLGDTWKFADPNWTLLSPALSPSPRSHHTMALSYNGEVSVFGGRDGNGMALGDLWLWDPAAQSWLPGPVGPVAREGAAMARGLVLFGGRDGTQTFNDLWSLSPATIWQNVTPAAGSPSARHGHSLVCAELHPPHWLLFGGIDGAGNHLADTWRLDQSGATFTWTQLSPATSPSARRGHATRWSRHRERVQLFGGEGPAGLLGDTWEWDGASWVSITTVGAPAVRADAVLVEAGSTPVTSPWRGLLVGGRDASGPLAEAWQAASTAPAVVTQFGGQPLPAPGLLVEPVWVGGALAVSMYDSLGGGPQLVAPHLIAGFSNTSSPLGPLPINMGPSFNAMSLLVDPVVLMPFGSVIGPHATFVAPVPASPGLIGAHLYVQGIVYRSSPIAAVSGWRLTVGVDCQLGWL